VRVRVRYRRKADQISNDNDLSAGLDEVASALVDEEVEVVLENEAVVIRLVGAVAVDLRVSSLYREADTELAG
jgi:hypothetical protein